MQLGFFVILAGALLTCFAQGHSPRTSNVLRRSGQKHPLFSHLQVSKRQILERESRPNAKRSPEPTPTTTTNDQSRSRFYRRQPDTAEYLRTKVYKYLTDCHAGLQQRVSTITTLCSSLTQENAKDVAWKILLELQAILALLVACANGIKGCPNEPTPSGTPGKAPCVEEICQLLYQILVLVKTCLQQINTSASTYPIIQSTCSDVLNQISSTLSNCVSSSGSTISGVLSGLQGLLGGGNISQFFSGLGSGMDQVLNVLQSL